MGERCQYGLTHARPPVRASTRIDRASLIARTGLIVRAVNPSNLIAGPRPAGSEAPATRHADNSLSRSPVQRRESSRMFHEPSSTSNAALGTPDFECRCSCLCAPHKAVHTVTRRRLSNPVLPLGSVRQRN